MEDYKGEDDVQIETEPKNSDFVKEHGELIIVSFRKYSAIKSS